LESFNEEGQLWSIENYKDGQRDGFTEYYNVGQLMSRVCYKNGEIEIYGIDDSYCYK